MENTGRGGDGMETTAKGIETIKKEIVILKAQYNCCMEQMRNDISVCDKAMEIATAIQIRNEAITEHDHYLLTKKKWEREREEKWWAEWDKEWDMEEENWRVEGEKWKIGEGELIIPATNHKNY